MADKKAKDTDSKRKMITIVLLVGIVGFLLWQVSDMIGFGGSSSSSPTPTPQPSVASASPAAVAQTQAVQQTPIAKALPMSPREQELLKLQQDTQAKYVQAMNQLQMLKLTLEIANTNKDIMAAKKATIQNQKDIVDLLSPKKQAQPNFRQDLSDGLDAAGALQSITNLQQAAQQQAQQQQAQQQQAQQQPPAPAEPRPVQQMPTQPDEPQVQYTVVSVSKLQGRWSAVIGVQGSLYSIHIGDIIPIDGSKVTKINSRGIMLEKNGKERRVSLVPII